MQQTEAAVAHGEGDAEEQPQLSHGDETLVLVYGFAFGLIVGGIFLLYVVLSAANLLT